MCKDIILIRIIIHFKALILAKGHGKGHKVSQNLLYKTILLTHGIYNNKLTRFHIVCLE